MPASIAHPLIFLRHGETEWNRQNRFQGATDIELNETGKKQAHMLGEKIANARLLDVGELRIFTSPLMRARQTASLVAGSFAQNGTTPAITPDDRLREVSFGRWEGLTSAEVKSRFYEERKSRKIDPWSFTPVDGESMAGRSAEIASFLGDLPPHSIIVAHSAILRIVAHQLTENSTDICATQAVPHTQFWLWYRDELHMLNDASLPLD